MALFVVAILIVNIALVIKGAMILGKKSQVLDFLKENYRPYLRQNENGYLEYSVDHLLWTPILEYNSCVKYTDIYSDYYGPGLLYVKVTKENEKELTKKFDTINKCWQNNIDALNEYRKAVEEFIKK